MKRSDKGQVLVLVALVIFVLLAFAALGIDAGYMYSVRHELQRCADSGALAGASKWVEPDSHWSSNPSDPVMVAADTRARDYATKDKVVTTALNRDTEVDVEFPSDYRIKVKTYRTVPRFFSRIFGSSDLYIEAKAVAEASLADTGITCLKPWGIPVPWVDSDNDGKYDSGEMGMDGKLPSNMDGVLDGTHMIIKIAEPFNKNQEIDLPSLQQESGHFFALDLCGDRGANDYRQRIIGECDPGCSVNIGDNLVLEPGNMVGPTKQGVDVLLNNPGTWDPAQIMATGTGLDNWKLSPRFVHIPIYSPSQMLNNGRTEMTVTAFAGFWIEGFESKQGTVSGYYVQDTAGPGAGGTGPGPGTILRVLRLVE